MVCEPQLRRSSQGGSSEMGHEGPSRVDCASIFKRFSNLVSMHGAALIGAKHWGNHRSNQMHCFDEEKQENAKSLSCNEADVCLF